MAFLLTVLLSGSAHAQGFSAGSEFHMAKYSGPVIVTCNSRGRIETVQFTCRWNTLLPETTARFVVNEDIDADSVKLFSTHEDKSVTSAKEKFSSKEKRSRPFDLIGWSFRKKPLLSGGRNAIEYVLKKGSSVVKQGQFDVNVVVDPIRQCEVSFHYSFDPLDCAYAASERVCESVGYMHHGKCE